MSPIVATLVSVAIVSLVSLVGIVTLAINRKRLAASLLTLVSFAVGGLFGDAIIHLMPEAFEAFDNTLVPSLFIILGILIFFAIEKFVRWRHCHVIDTDDAQHETHHHHQHPVAAMNLIGDGVHNFIDGALIASSYLANIPLGIATTIAVVLHEIPTEIGDFGVLLHSGVPARKAVWYNFATATMAIAGALVALSIGESFAGFASVVVPITAGGFLYIAGSDLIPELHHETKVSTSLKQLTAIVLGVLVMAALTFLE